MAKAIENLRRQALPLQTYDSSDGQIHYSVLTARKRLVVAEQRVTQYVVDLENAGHVSLTEVNEAIDPNFT